MIDLVVLDVAGTTVRDDGDVVARCMASVLAGANVQVDVADVNPVMGLRKPLAIATLLESARGGPPEPDEVARIHDRFRASMVEYYASSADVAAMPGAETLFEGLRRRGVLIALDTGFDRTILDAILDRLNWRSLLDATVASDEVQRGRPHPDMIRSLTSRLGITDSARVCKVGDSIADIQEGVNASCGLVVAIRNVRTHAVLDGSSSVASIDHLDELLEHVDARSRVGA